MCPMKKMTNFFFNLYQVIPIFRGKTEQGAFKKAIDILRSDGQIAIFPEGGHFDPGPHASAIRCGVDEL